MSSFRSGQDDQRNREDRINEFAKPDELNAQRFVSQLQSEAGAKFKCSIGPIESIGVVRVNVNFMSPSGSPKTVEYGFVNGGVFANFDLYPLHLTDAEHAQINELEPVSKALYLMGRISVL